jgi:transcriptional regulator with XRE-family HTH domain
VDMTATLPRPSGFDLRERRRLAELRQADIAARLGVTRVRVSAIEAQAAPAPRAIRRYLEALAALEAER